MPWWQSHFLEISHLRTIYFHLVFFFLALLHGYVYAWSLGCIRFCHPLSLLFVSFVRCEVFDSCLHFIFMLWTPQVYERDVLMPQFLNVWFYTSLDSVGELGVSSCLVFISPILQR